MNSFNEIVLTKESNNSDIKKYFESVKQMRDSGEKFPVDLNSIWRLMFNRKDSAVRALKNESDKDGYLVEAPRDYKHQNLEVRYMLSIDCMEWFIRRNRTVFDIYKDVFIFSNNNQSAQQDMISMEQANAIAKNIGYNLGLSMRDAISSIVNDAIKSGIKSMS